MKAKNIALVIVLLIVSFAVIYITFSALSARGYGKNVSGWDLNSVPYCRSVAGFPYIYQEGTGITSFFQPKYQREKPHSNCSGLGCLAGQMCPALAYGPSPTWAATRNSLIFRAPVVMLTVILYGIVWLVFIRRSS